MDTDQPDESDPVVREEIIAARRLELDVRRTAQQILYRHLQWPAGADEPADMFWNAVTLDLRDATLVEVELRHCRIAFADFRNAVFYGHAWFDGATFTGHANFGEATFTGRAEFVGATFTEDARFDRVTFSRGAGFERVTFARGARFVGATSAGGAWFDRATFTGHARFDRVTFTADAGFVGATFTGGARFDRATFAQGAGFERVTFAGDTRFDKATLTAGISFNSARVIDPHAEHVWPDRWSAIPDTYASDGSGLLVRTDPSRDRESSDNDQEAHQ
jgi:uncharacterized protein YjbI with pentapeptide repeats